MKLPWKTITGILGITAAIIWSIHGVDFVDVVAIVKNMSVSWALVVLALTSFNLVIRAIAWKCIVNPIKPIAIGRAIGSYLIGVFSNLFLPFKLGDVAQGYSLGRREDVSKISAVSAVLIQRVFEITTLLLIMSIIATLFSFPLLFNRQTALFGLLIIGGIVALLVVFNKREAVLNLIESVLSRIAPKIAAPVKQFFESFLDGTGAMHNLSDVAKIGSLSLLSWTVQILMVYITAHSLSIHIDLIKSSVVLMAINLGLALPIAPGNIGTFQVFSIIALSWFSIDKPEALTFSIIFQVIQGIPVIIGGGLSVMGEMLRTKQRQFEQSVSNDGGIK